MCDFGGCGRPALDAATRKFGLMLLLETAPRSPLLSWELVAESAFFHFRRAHSWNGEKLRSKDGTGTRMSSGRRENRF